MGKEFYNNHYITTRPDGAITDTWSDGPYREKDAADAICINDKGSYQFRLYPGGEENPPIYTMDGIPLYKYVDGKVIARTEDEIDDDRLAIPPAPPSLMEQLRADVDFIAIMSGVDL